MTPQLEVFSSSEELVRAAANRIVASSKNAIAERGQFTLALAGGSTPKALYQLLATPEFASQIDWKKTHIFFGDERAFPREHEYSNARMASESLLNHVPLPTENICYMNGSAENLEAAARDYENELRAVTDRLDVVLLGMGDDGHTASLFPDYAALDESEKLCAATDVSPTPPPSRRITLTFPALNAAREVLLLITGEGKAKRVQEAWQQLVSTQIKDALPVARVRPGDGRLIWMLDEGAARQVK